MEDNDKLSNRRGLRKLFKEFGREEPIFTMVRNNQQHTHVLITHITQLAIGMVAFDELYDKFHKLGVKVLCIDDEYIHRKTAESQMRLRAILALAELDFQIGKLSI